MARLLVAAAHEVRALAGRRPLGEFAYAASDVLWPLSHLFMLAVWRRRAAGRGVDGVAPLGAARLRPHAAHRGRGRARRGGRDALLPAFCALTAATFLTLGTAVAAAPNPAPAAQLPRAR